MGSIRISDTTDALFMDFRYLGRRCREYTAIIESPANRKKLERILTKIESYIAAGTFVYANYFPNSKALSRLSKAATSGLLEQPKVDAEAIAVPAPLVEASAATPLFKDFANQWVDEHSIEWRRSHIRSLLSTINGRLIPHCGGKTVGEITKSDILAFRATLAKAKGRGEKEGLSPKRINEIIGTLSQILVEASDRFGFTTPTTNIKRLRLRKTDVDPFNLNDVQRILATVRADYKQYFVTRFLTGMRTGEVHGLKWKYVDFDLRVIRVRETFVLGEDEYTKTDGSQRDIQMSQPVFEALQEHYKATAKVSEYVFCNLLGQPLDNKSFSDRVWYPLLRHLGLQKRRPYQMRHTAATLWLASGEAPEWIARQLGHTSTEMLFRVYSRYVPNLTRQDGSAMDRLLASRLATGPLVLADPDQQGGGEAGVYVPIQAISPQPVPKPRGIRGLRSAIPNNEPVIAGTKSKSMGLPSTYDGSEPQPPPARMWEAVAVPASVAATSTFR